jgi:3-hydroxyacyl-[acyl-carrier-protein] dehydratase
MLKDHFYHIISTNHQDHTIAVTLQLNIDHVIFGGHFPGQPVVPGACMLQIVKDVLNNTLNIDYQLKKADHLKFIAPVDPRMVDELELKLSYKQIEAGLQVTGSLSANGVVCFKMQGSWAVAN